MRGQMQYIAMFIFIVMCLFMLLITISLGPDLARAFSDGTSDRSVFGEGDLGFISANLFPIAFVLVPLLILFGGIAAFRSGG